MRRRPLGRLRHLLGLGLAGAVVGHGLTVAWIARGPRGAAEVQATGHAYWASWGDAAIGAALVTAAASLLAFALAHLRSAPARRRPDDGTLAAAGVRLAAFQVAAFGVTEVVERLAGHDAWSTLLDHRILLAGVVVQLAVAAVAAQALRLVRRAATVLAQRRRRSRPTPDARRWSTRPVARLASLRHFGLAPSRAPPTAA
jgi:hypothetical protein